MPDIAVFADVALCDHHDALHTVARSQSHLQAPGTIPNINAGVKGLLDLCHATGALQFGRRNKLRCVGSKILRAFSIFVGSQHHPQHQHRGQRPIGPVRVQLDAPAPG